MDHHDTLAPACAEVHAFWNGQGVCLMMHGVNDDQPIVRTAAGRRMPCATVSRQRGAGACR
jgi:hypothetical protein